MKVKIDKMFKKIFSVDNRFMRFCERILDLLVLNLLFIFTCLPLVTIGIAKMSLYQVLLTLREEQHVAVLPSYITAVRANSKRGLLLGLGEVTVILVCLLDMRILGQLGNGLGQVLRLVCIAMLFLLLMTSFYLYPLALRDQSPYFVLIKKAFLLTCLNFPWSFLMVGILGLIYLILYSSLLTFLLGMSILILIGFAALGYAYMSFMERLVEKYLTLGFRME
ncbi:DUF624 domain-containing protein [Streptococcus gallolyticus]|uniref:YesL family protein n=1 Tax=Streptococcus hepaticus TaxID=3349163 RepID=UPI001C94696F|nr:DUF624 domain-containing protein [Streptococcus gallolyticus]MBY5041211.1 DUF624 domain-containing protein [Streptococcus gallolyticus]